MDVRLFIQRKIVCSRKRLSLGEMIIVAIAADIAVEIKLDCELISSCF